MLNKGAYCLCIEVKERILVRVGALGEIWFNPGQYIYVGSALNGLKARVQRHLKNSRGEHDVTHWHIDYLLREKNVVIDSIYVQYSPEKTECKIAEQVSMHGKPFRGFGCSDCRCSSHLYIVDDCSFLCKFGLEKIKLEQPTK